MRAWHPLRVFSFILAAIVLNCHAVVWAGDPVKVTLLHTNDLHSHFRPDVKPPYLGGVARLKTAITKYRRANPNTLLVDGGDWSEGQIYYVPGGGAETLRMMEHLSYDVAVVGNHDWLNGPNVLLKAINEVSESTGLKMALVGANLDARALAEKTEFNRRIPPYVIREIGGARIAFIGLSTYELIYDRFFKPVEITAPFEVTRDLARSLKGSVDAVIVISHNNLKMNRQILEGATDVDLIIGAHDHRTLNEPVVVRREDGTQAWLVEAGEFGHFLGKIELTITPRKRWSFGFLEDPRVKLQDYRLIQMDRSVAEDPATLDQLQRLEDVVEAHFGKRMFNEHVAHNHVDIDNHAAENLFGNLVTDSYLSAAPDADFALEHMRFMYSPLRKGALTPADFFNALAGVYDPRTDRTWTVKTFQLKGSSLKWLLGTLFSTNFFFTNDERPAPSIATSGIAFRVKPLFGGAPLDLSHSLISPESTFALVAQLGLAGAPVDDIRIAGRPVEPDQMYRIATSNGILFTVDFINSMLPNAIQIREVRDTGLQRWRVLSKYVRNLSPLTSSEISVGNRMRTAESDLGFFADDVQVLSLQTIGTADGRRARARLQVRIRNFGDQMSPTNGPTIRAFAARNPLELTAQTDWVEVSRSETLRALRRGESQLVTLDVEASGKQGLYPVRLLVEGGEHEDNPSNNEIEYWLEAAR